MNISDKEQRGRQEGRIMIKSDKKDRKCRQEGRIITYNYGDLS